MIAFIRFLIHLNILKTLYFNFKAFPWRVALKTPVYIYGKCKIKSLSGKVILPEQISRGMIQIGRPWYIDFHKTRSTLNIQGTVEFKGDFRFLRSTYILVSPGSEMTLGRSGIIGTNAKILCFHRIHLGSHFRAAWGLQIMDTSFHYTMDEQGAIAPLTSPVEIGDYCWLGNRVTISKGARLPVHCIVASNSLCNKDFTKQEEGILIGGIPARLIKSKIWRVFDDEKQKALDNKFGYNRTYL
jgi:acetyltransferase-like isoleucine patch superfamily enzyme